MNNNSNIHRQQQQQQQLMSSPTGTPPTTPPQRAVQTSDQHQQHQQQQHEPLDPPQILATPISRHYNHHKPQQEEEKDDDLLEKATAAQQPKEDVLQHNSPPHSPSVNLRVDSHQSTSYLQTTPQQHNALPVIHFPPPPQSRQQQQQQQQQITLSPFSRSTSNISQQTTVYYNRQPVPTKTKPEQQIQHAIQDLYTDDYSEDNEDEKEDELQHQPTHHTTTNSKPPAIAIPACGDDTTTNVTPQKEECDDDIEPVVIIRPFEGNMLRRLMLPLLLVFVSYFLIFASCDSVSVLSSSLFASSGLLSSALTYVVVIILALMGPILTFFVHPLLAATVLSVFAYTAFIACNFSVDSIIVGGLLSGLGGICGFALNMFVLMYSQYVADQDFLTYLRSPQCLKDQLVGCGPQDVGVVDDEKKLKTIDEVEVYITRITDSNDRVVRHALLEENPEHFARWKLTVDHRIATTNSFLTMVTNMGSLVGSVVSFCILHFLKSGGEVLTASSPIIRTLFIILLCCAFAGNVIFLVAYLLTPKAATATISTNSKAVAAAKANENNTTTHAEPEQQKQQNMSILSSLKLTVVTGFYLLKTKPILLSLFSIFVAYTPLGFVSGTFVSRGGVSGKLGLEYVIMFNAIISFCAVGISMFFGKVFVVGTLPRARALLALGVGFNIATLLVILMQPSSDWANLGHSWGVCAAIAVLAALSSTTTGTALSSFIAFQCASPNLRAPGFCLVNIVKSLGLCITFLLAVFTDFYIQLYVLLGAFVVSLAFQFINVYTSWVIDVDDIQRQLEIWTAKQERHQPARPYPGQQPPQQPQQTARRNSHIQRTSLYGDFYEEYREAQPQPGQHTNRRSTHMNRPDVEMVQTHRRSTAFTQHHQQLEHHHKARVSYVFEEPRKSNNYFHATGGATTIGRQYGVAGDDITGVNHDAQQYYYEQRMSNQHMNLDDDDEQDPLRQSYAITYRQSINRLHHQQY